jgi:hypothetical protein
MKIKTAEEIVKIAEEKTNNYLGQKRIVNKLFRLQDDSHLWPIKNRFSVVERAIRKTRKADCDCLLSYALTIENIKSEIVNNSKNW